MAPRVLAVAAFGVTIVLLGGLGADARTIPVQVTAGNITVECSRLSSSLSGYDEVDFYLTGMTGSAAGRNTDGTQCRINILQGRWTAGASGAFWVATTQLPTPIDKGRTVNTYWETPTCSTANFDSYVSGATIWTNTAGGGGFGPQTSGNLYNYFSGIWYTLFFDSDLVYPPNPSYSGNGTASTYLAALYVTAATPDVGLAYDGKISFTYDGGTVEVARFMTTLQPRQPGDANEDGNVDIADLNIVLTNFDKSGLVWNQGDFDGNGTVDVADLNKLLTNYNATSGATGSSIQSVPEPATAALLVAGAVGLTGFARRRRHMPSWGRSLGQSRR